MSPYPQQTVHISNRQCKSSDRVCTIHTSFSSFFSECKNLSKEVDAAVL